MQSYTMNDACQFINTRLEECLLSRDFKKGNLLVKLNKLNYSENSTVFSNENSAYCISCHEDIKQIKLLHSTMEDGKIDNNWSEISSWMYDPETYSKKDAQSIAEDFIEIISGSGNTHAVVKKTKKNKDSDDKEINPMFLINRLASLWPDLKSDIQAEKTSERFKYVTFTKKHILPKISELMNGSDSLKKKKLFALLSDQYKLGDMDVQSIITIVILNSITGETQISDAEEYLSDDLKKVWKYARTLIGKNIKPEKPRNKKSSFMARTLENANNSR